MKEFPEKELKQYFELVEEVESNIEKRFQWTKFFGKDLLETQQKIIELAKQFYKTVTDKSNCTREELIEFCRKATPLLKENIKNAAISEINELHKEVMEYKEGLTEAQWKDVIVVITGSHMARKGNLVTQYFARLLDVDAEEDQRIIFAESCWDEEVALDLLATNATDTEASAAFFSDPTYLHSDVLANPTEEYLDSLFEGGNKSVYVALGQLYIIPPDTQGNLKRIRSVIKDGKKGGADLVCLPELIFEEKFAEPASGSLVDHLKTYAKHYKVYLTFGMLQKEDEVINKSLFLISYKGKILLQRKEKEDITTFETSLGKIAVITFSESQNKESLKQLKDVNPDLIAIPVGVIEPKELWPLNKDFQLSSGVGETAKFLGKPIIAVNSISESLWNQWSQSTDGSGSIVMSGKGEPLRECRPSERQVKLTKITYGTHNTFLKWQKLKSMVNKPEFEILKKSKDNQKTKMSVDESTKEEETKSSDNNKSPKKVKSPKETKSPKEAKSPKETKTPEKRGFSSPFAMLRKKKKDNN